MILCDRCKTEIRIRNRMEHTDQYDLCAGCLVSWNKINVDIEYQVLQLREKLRKEKSESWLKFVGQA